MKAEGVKGKVAIGVVERENRLLILKRSNEISSGGKWCFPGGKIEDGETPREAAVREVNEETGLKVKVRESGQNFTAEGELGEWKIYPFLMSDHGGEVELNHESSEYIWLGKDEIEEYNTLGDMQAIDILDL